MPRVRPPAVAGLFYPAEPERLRGMIRGYLAEVETNDPPPKAIIAPHAGYVYSGPIAASAYATLLPIGDKIRKVVLLGPSHRVAFTGIALPTAKEFNTPLGNIKIDSQLSGTISSMQQVVYFDAGHEHEHSLEVHLPFLQTVLDDFLLLPLVVGDVQPQEVSEVLQQIWGDSETLVVVSSDLSHYLSYGNAQKRDNFTSNAIENCHTHINGEQACGYLPINGLLKLAKQISLDVDTVDVRNSGDTAGDRERVVGYGAYLFHERAPSRL